MPSSSSMQLLVCSFYDNNVRFLGNSISSSLSGYSVMLYCTPICPKVLVARTITEYGKCLSACACNSASSHVWCFLMAEVCTATRVFTRRSRPLLPSSIHDHTSVSSTAIQLNVLKMMSTFVCHYTITRRPCKRPFASYRLL